MIDIVIVNWNSGSQLKDCVQSIIEFNSNKVSKILVIDNNSTDSSLSQLRDRTSDFNISVQIVRNKINNGFGTACNQGAALSTTEYLLFLNPDAALRENTIHTALDFMDEPLNSSVGICGVQLEDTSGHISRSCSRFPRPLFVLAQALGLNRFFKQFGSAMMEWPHDQTREVDQVIGAFFLVRRSLFEALNGFDERFFVYYEEVDFSYRSRQVGWLSFYLSEAQAFHSGGGTSNQVKARRLFYSQRSRLLYAHKHFNPVGVSIVWLVTMLIEPISRTIMSIWQRSWLSFRELWHAYLMLCRWIPLWLLKGVIK